MKLLLLGAQEEHVIGTLITAYDDREAEHLQALVERARAEAHANHTPETQLAYGEALLKWAKYVDSSDDNKRYARELIAGAKAEVSA